MLSIVIKHYTKHRKSNSLLSRDKAISSLLELIDHVLLISECFGKTLVAFDFDEKLPQSVAQIICNIICKKNFFACTLRLIKNMAVIDFAP